MQYPCINIFSFARRMGRPLILDGAMGSLLQQSGIKTDESLWTSLSSVHHADLVMKIHKDYIESGADIITTNTFRSNPYSVEHSEANLNSDLLVNESLKLARLSVGTLPVLIAGSNAPAEDCYQKERKIGIKELESNHIRHIDMLKKYGCDFILNETQSHLDEINIICRYSYENKIPYVLSLFFNEDLTLLSGESIFEVLPLIQSFKPLAIGFNCISPVTFQKFISRYKIDFNWGVYLNCGSGNILDKDISCGINEDEYCNLIRNIIQFQPSFVGACCGSNPKHIKKIREYFSYGIS